MTLAALPPRETLNPLQVWKFLSYPGRAATRLYNRYGALARIGFFGAKYTLVLTPEAALQVYTAARLAIEPDTRDEQAFLQELSTGLGVDAQLAAHIDAETSKLKV